MAKHVIFKRIVWVYDDSSVARFSLFLWIARSIYRNMNGVWIDDCHPDTVSKRVDLIELLSAQDREQ